MTGIKKLFADAAKFLYLGVGISDPGTIPRKVDLWKLADRDEKSWRRFNLSASKLHHQGKEAVRLESCGEGLALFEAVELPVGKLNLSIASNQTSGQTVGVAIRAENQNRYELVLFDVLSDASSSRLTIRYGSRSVEMALPSFSAEEWINVRVVVDSLFTAVFVNGNNMPALKVSTEANTGVGNFIGLWASGVSALVADLRYIQTKKRDFE